jgi:predicted dehydrogenase
MIDLARWYVGEIASVCARLDTLVERPGPDGEALEPANDSAMLLLAFENGAQGAIHVSAVAHTADRVQEQHIILHGASGTLEADHSMQGTDWAQGVYRTTSELRGARGDSARFEVLPIPERLWANADPSWSYSVFNGQPVGPRLFVDAIVEDKPIAPSFYDGFKAQQVIDAAGQSHEEGRWISLEK